MKRIPYFDEVSLVEEQLVPLGAEGLGLGQQGVLLVEEGVAFGEELVLLVEEGVALGEELVLLVEEGVALGEELVFLVEEGVAFGEELVFLVEEGVALGADGVISVVSNEAPAATARMIAAALEGDFLTARELHYRLLPLIRANFVETNPVPVKTAMQVLGRCGGSLRAPLGPPAPETRETITAALDTLEKVRLVSFEYTEDYQANHAGVGDGRYLNVIAQEFAQVFPDHVRGSGEQLPDGSEILQVDTYPLTIYAAAAIQELRADSDRRLAEKDAQIADLTARLERLERRVAGR